MKKDEYDDIYEQYQNSGLIFQYHKRLSHSKDIFEEELNQIDSSKYNDDMLIVNCKNCDALMNYISGKGTRGHYQCPVCKSKVRESTLYNQLERENSSFLSRWKMDIPEGCIACGGPYPDCIDECSLYDD